MGNFVKMVVLHTPFFHSFPSLALALKSRTDINFRPHSRNVKVPSLWNTAILTKFWLMAMVSVVVSLSVVSAQSFAARAMTPNDVPSPAVGDAGCFRPLSDVIWGFLVTLLACSVAFWGRSKHRTLERREKITAVLLAVFTPIHDLHNYISASFVNAMLIRKYQKSRQTLQSLSRRRHIQELWSPVSKFQGRILFWCDVVVYVEKESSLLELHLLWSEERIVKVESEAVVIGEVAAGKTKDGDYERKELSSVGILALMLAEVLPEYDELKFLRGNSGFAMIAIGIQALGYITAVVFREVKDLPVAPLEVVGLILNIILLIEVSAYSFFNPCHRPLVIYLNLKQEGKLIEVLATMKELYNIPWDPLFKMSNLVISMVDLCLCGIVVYFIVTLIQVSNIFVVLPLILFVIATIILIIDSIKWHFFGSSLTWEHMIDWFTIPLYIIVYTWALVATIVYWKPQHFNTRAELFNISQLIPFIG